MIPGDQTQLPGGLIHQAGHADEWRAVWEQGWGRALQMDVEHASSVSTATPAR